MYNLSDLDKAFPELNGIKQLSPQSGQKNVFKAKKNGSDFVLKIMIPNPEALSSMQVEIEAVQKLNSNHIPKIYESGTRQIGSEDFYYLVEEFIPGSNLREVIKNKQKKAIPYIFNFLDQVLKACVEFEENRLVHRDIKPENLIEDIDSKFWIIDFGIVRHLDEPSRTATNKTFGRFTLGYGAPEQIRNEKPQIDSKCDLYSVGIVAYELITGSNPYLQVANPMTALRKVENEDLPRITIEGDNNNQLSDFISSLISRFPSRRPQTAKEAINWFRDIKENF